MKLSTKGLKFLENEEGLRLNEKKRYEQYASQKPHTAKHNIQTFPQYGGVIKPTYLIVHYDAAHNATSAINWMTNPVSKVSAHLHIGRDGNVVQLVEFNKRAYHLHCY